MLCTYALLQPLAPPWCHHRYFQVTRNRAYEYAVHICTASTPGTPMVSPYILPGHVLMKQMHCINVWHPFGVTIDGIYTYTSWSHVDGTYIYALHQPLAPLWCHHRWYIHVYFLVSLPVCAHPLQRLQHRANLHLCAVARPSLFLVGHIRPSRLMREAMEAGTSLSCPTSLTSLCAGGVARQCQAGVDGVFPWYVFATALRPPTLNVRSSWVDVPSPHPTPIPRAPNATPRFASFDGTR